MLNILLVCNQGTSISMFIKRISDYASGKGIETSVDAVSFVDMDAYADKTDILLIGPQARYQYKKMQAEYGEKISVIQVIDMASFGLLKADKVFDEAYKEYISKAKAL
jgi:PTS system cellobiose-specific IIB component